MTQPSTRFRLGRKPNGGKPRIRLTADELLGVAVQPPVKVDYYSKVEPSTWGMDGNDKVGDCTCFPAGTQIRMADGTSRSIEDVRLMDRVLSAEGVPRDVTAVMLRQHIGDLVVPTLSGIGHLRMTPEHPVLTRRGYVAADQLVPGDMVATPRYAPGSRELIACRSHVRTAARGKQLPDKLTMTPGLGRLFGLWLAEGWVSVTTLRWTLGGHEQQTLAADIVDLVGSELGVTAAVNRTSSGAIDVVVRGKQWAELFVSLLGRGAAGTRLHADVWAGPADFRAALLRGWLDGAGHRVAGHEVGTTISRALAQDMFNLAGSLDIMTTISRSDRVDHRTRWDVSLGGHDTRDEALQVADLARAEFGQPASWQVERDDHVTWRSVRTVRREPFAGFVYNLSVAVDESYVAEGVGVHNCAEVDHAVKAMQVAAGNHEVTSTPEQVVAMYSAITGYSPDDPNSDNGAEMQAVRNYWRTNGFRLGGTDDKILLFAELDHRNTALVEYALDRFGEVGLGIHFPESAMTQFNAGEPWDVVKRAHIEGGHAIALVGYDSDYYYVITWGKVQKMTPAFFSHYVEEAWVSLSLDFVNSVSGDDPFAETLYELGQQFARITGKPNPVPAPGR